MSEQDILARLQSIEGALRGDGSEGSGISPRLASTERLTRENARQISEMVRGDTKWREDVRALIEAQDDKCEARASAVHRRVDEVAEEVAVADEQAAERAAEAVRPVNTELQRQAKDIAAGKWWIRGALWVGGIGGAGLLGLLIWSVQKAAEAVAAAQQVVNQANGGH